MNDGEKYGNVCNMSNDEKLPEIVDLVDDSSDVGSGDNASREEKARFASHFSSTNSIKQSLPSRKRQLPKSSKGGVKSRKMGGQASIMSFLSGSPNSKNGSKQLSLEVSNERRCTIAVDDENDELQPLEGCASKDVTETAAAVGKSIVPQSSTDNTKQETISVSSSSPESGSIPESRSAVPKRTLELSCFGGSPATVGKSGADLSSSVPAARFLAEDYDPVKDACWKAGDPAPYLHIARAMDLIEHEKGRIKMATVICNMFRSLLALSPQAVMPAAHLVAGRMPLGIDLSVGGAAVMDAIRECTGVSRARMHTLYVELGDPGDVAQICRSNQRVLLPPPPLRIEAVYSTLHAIAAQTGSGSTARRKALITSLLRSCREQETRYIVRTLIQNMRIGMNTRLVLAALAAAVVHHRYVPTEKESSRPKQKAKPQPTARGRGASKGKISSAASSSSATAVNGNGNEAEGEGGLAERVKAAAAAAQRAYALCPSLEKLVPALVEGGIELMLQRCRLTPGMPVQPMLAKVSTSVNDLIAQFTKRFPTPVALLTEYKYDGQRALIHHLPDGQVRIYSRNCEDKTDAFPDVIEVIKKAAAAGPHAGRAFIVDSEIVAVKRIEISAPQAFASTSAAANEGVQSEQTSDSAQTARKDLQIEDLTGGSSDKEFKNTLEVTKTDIEMKGGSSVSTVVHSEAVVELLPMQQLATRARGAVTAKEVKMDVCVFLFDLLCVGERNAADESLRSRRALLFELFPKMVPGYIEPARCVEVSTDDVEAEDTLQSFLGEALNGQCEGLVVKVLDGALYEPGRRADSWMKLKKDYIDGMADSLDLVPIGAWYGNGRKVGWFSPWLLAAHNPDTGELQSLCRCMSGFTDSFYKEATQRFKERIIPEPRAYYVTGESPDVWFEASEVWELRGAELTISPVHKAGLGLLSEDKGLSLRFPRFLRVRDDKQVEDATTGAQLVDLYRLQSRRQKDVVSAVAAAVRRAATVGAHGAERGDGSEGEGSDAEGAAAAVVEGIEEDEEEEEEMEDLAVALAAASGCGKGLEQGEGGSGDGGKEVGHHGAS